MRSFAFVLVVLVLTASPVAHAQDDADKSNEQVYGTLQDLVEQRLSEASDSERGTVNLAARPAFIKRPEWSETSVELTRLRLQYQKNDIDSGRADAVLHTEIRGHDVELPFNGLRVTVEDGRFGLISGSGRRGPPGSRELNFSGYSLHLDRVKLDLSVDENHSTVRARPDSFRGLVLKKGTVSKRLNITSTNTLPDLTFGVRNQWFSFNEFDLTGTFRLETPERFCVMTPTGGHLFVTEGQITLDESRFEGMEIDGGLQMPERLRSDVCTRHRGESFTALDARRLMNPDLVRTNRSLHPIVAGTGKRGSGQMHDIANGSLEKRLITFSGVEVNDQGDFYAENLDMGRTPFFDEKFALEASNVTLDYSDQKSPSGNVHGLTLADDDEGVYIKQGSLYLTFLDDKSIEFSEFFVGDQGLYGSVRVTGSKQSPVFPDLKLGGFSFLFTKVGVTFEQSALVGSEVTSWISVPLGDGKEVKTNVKFGENGLQSVSVEGQGDTKWSFLNGKVTINIRQATFDNASGNDWSLAVDGDIKGNVKKLSMEEGGGISFNGLKMDGDGNFRSKETWVNTGNGATIDFEAAKMAVQKVGFGQNNSGSKLWFGFSASVDMGKGFGAKTSHLKVWFHKKPFKFDRFDVKSFGISFNKHGVKFSGQVELRDSGFRAKLDIAIKRLNLQIKGVLETGTKADYRYWRVYVDFSLPGSGIPLSPIPASIYGFGGGFASNMEVTVSDNGRDTSFSPKKGVFSFQLSISMGSPDNHKTWYAKGTLTIQPKPLVINFPVKCWVFKDGTPSGDAPITATLNVTKNSFLLKGKASPPIKVGSFTSDPEIELFFNNSKDWHIHVGKESHPVPVNIAGVPAKGYLKVNSDGKITLACAVGGQFKKEFKFVKKFRIEVQLEAGVKVALEIQRAYFMAQVDVDIGVGFYMYRTPAFSDNHWDKLMSLGVGLEAKVEVWGRQKRWKAQYDAYVEVTVVGIGVDKTVNGTASGTF